MKRTPIPKRIRNEVIKRDGRICRYCGKSMLTKIHIDHVYPFSKGGETEIDNLVVSCEKCNIRKSANVGIWPKPIGYFDKRKISKSTNIPYVLFSIAFTLSYFLFKIVENRSQFYVVIGGWAVLMIIAIVYWIAWKRRDRL